MDLYNKKLFQERELEQLYCDKCQMFLADRYVNGTCPNCKKPGARGDQCDSCSKLLNADELIDSFCVLCKTPPHLKKSNHLYLDLPKLSKDIDEWAEKSITNGNWSNVAKSITRGWIKDGIKERCITRDLKWGTQVPLEKFKDKVFYVWFDAPIGYISITANYCDEWEQWWKLSDEYSVEYYQFLAKDNVPFHSIIFPGTLIGTGKKWKLVDGLRSTHYLNYENTKFSKSNNTGVFGNQAKDTGIPVEVWRYYLLTNRPEQQDTQFFWGDLAEKNNNELLKNLGNFVNRALKFCKNNFEGIVPNKFEISELDKKLENDVNELLKKYNTQMNAVKIKDGIHTVLQISKAGNVYIQDNKPWELIKTDKNRCSTIINLSVNLVYCVITIIQPYMPSFTKKVLKQLNFDENIRIPICDTFVLDAIKAGYKIGDPQPIFEKLAFDKIKELKRKFSGTKPFTLDLRIGLVEKVEDHPSIDKLYVLTVNIGKNEHRNVCAGIKDKYKKEEILGKKIILICNLKEKVFKEITSKGMLLAERLKRELRVLFPDKILKIGTSISPKDHSLDFSKEVSLKSVKSILKTVRVNEKKIVNVNAYPFFSLHDGKEIILFSELGKGAKLC